MSLSDIRLIVFYILILSFIELFNYYVAGCYDPTIENGRQNTLSQISYLLLQALTGEINVRLDGCQLSTCGSRE